MKQQSSSGSNHSSPRHAVELNIGGQVFTVSSGIADKFPNCRLARILQGGSQSASLQLRDSQGRPFFDRNPAVFGVALDFLRQGGRFLPPGGAARFDDWERLEAEAEYLQLPELAAQLRTAQRDRGGGSIEARLEELLECVRDLQRPPAASGDLTGATAALRIAYLEVGETVQAVFLEGVDPQRQLLLQGEFGLLREVLRKRCSPLMPRLQERADELIERRGRRLGDADIVGLHLSEAGLRERGFSGGLDEFRLTLLGEIARVALPGPPTQLTLPNGEHRLLFRVASLASALDG